MPEPIIEVENLSKLYRLGVCHWHDDIAGVSRTLVVSDAWQRGPATKGFFVPKNLMIEPDDPQAGLEPNSIWALRDVSFSVQQGEIVGIIGKNGVGNLGPRC